MVEKQTKYYIGIALLLIIGVFLFNYQNNKVTVPTVGEDGKVDGNYSIAGIMKLGRPYVCAFEKTDGASSIAGVIHTDGQKIYGEFKIKTDLVKAGFSSFLLIKDGLAYTWTSLQNIGYQSEVAKSASKNASPREQAQIVGTLDTEAYRCEPWLEATSSVFQTPSAISFSELKQ